MRFLKSIILVALLLIFSECSEKKEHYNAKSPRISYYQEIDAIRILCIKELTPKHIIELKKNQNPKGTKLNLYIGQEIFGASKETIEHVIKLGASPLLKGIDREIIGSGYFSEIRCEIFNDVCISSRPPLVTKEVRENAGGIIFSEIVFNETRTKAACVFDFTLWRREDTNHFWAVELEKTKTWNIKSKILIQKNDTIMLFSNGPVHRVI